MNISSSLRFNLRLFGLSSLLAFGASGCIVDLGTGNQDNSTGNSTFPFPNNPTTPGAQCGLNAVVDANLQCSCQPGYSWCDPTVDAGPSGRHNCCVGEAPSNAQPCASGSNNFVDVQDPTNPEDDLCRCIAGFDWCDMSVGSDDLNCCAVLPGGGVPGGQPNASEHPEPGSTCDPNTTFVWCSHDETQGPQGSTYYVCEGNTWVNRTAQMDSECQSNGFDFAYGCVHKKDANGVETTDVECGDGPGTACDVNTPDTCSEDATTLSYCNYGRLTSQVCTPAAGETCKTSDGNEFENGKCGPQDGRLSCLCFDEDPSGTTTGGDTGSGTTTTTN